MWRAFVILLTALAMVAVTQTVTPRSADAAPDNGVADLLQLLGPGPDTLSDWTSGLGAVGRLGEPLPLVQASPGGLLGFTDLFRQAVADELADATDFGDLAVDRDITIDGDRTGRLTTTVDDVDGGGKRLNITVTVEKTATAQDLRISNAEPKVELSVADGATVALKARLAISVVWTGATEQVYVVRDANTPRLDVDARATMDSATATASIGILGVTLNGSDLNADAHLVATVSDPDGDGRLAFGATGELSKPGSLAGLVEAGLDPQGSRPIDESDPDNRGSVDATFQLGAAASGIPGLELPSSISATVDVDWPDIGTGAPTVSAPDLAGTVGRFQNMGLQDLAEGIAQVVAAITAVQKAKVDPDGDGPLPAVGDLDLPFLKGTLADAIAVNAVLKDFLAANTVPAPGQPGFVDGVTDPAQAGQPTFTSLQDLLRKLAEFAGNELEGVTWDADDAKLAITLAMRKDAPAQPVDLDPQSAAAAGTSGQYGARTLTVPGAGWTPNQWLGRRVTAGTAAGEVESNTADTITLKADWIGGRPDNSTPYVISGEDAHVGAVTLANRVDDGSGHGLVNANADQTFAKVTPSFAASLTLVLDLQDPRTGSDCVGFLGSTQACPFAVEEGQVRSVVESLPRASDRVLIRTGSPLFTADFPITTAVDLTANAGFVKVRLNGELKVCNSSLPANCSGGPATGHMLTVGLKDRGDLRLSEFFGALVDDPASLLDIDVNVRAHGALTVSLPGAEQFLPAGSTAAFTASWGDLVDPSTIALDTSDLSEIFRLDFDAADPQALFRVLIRTLQTLSAQLATTNTDAGSGVFDADIPGLGRSLRDLLLADESNGGAGVTFGANSLTDSTRASDNPFGPRLVGRTVVVGTQIGVIKEVSADGTTLVLTDAWQTVPAAGTPYALRSALDDAIDQLLAITPDNLQDAVALLNRTLGTESVKFRYLDVGGVGHVVLDVDWRRSYRAASPVRLALGEVGGANRTFAGAEASGTAQVDVDGRVKVGLAVPLVTSDGPVDGLSLKVLEDSSISVGAKAALTDGIVKGVVGPLSISLGNPTAGAPSAEKAQARADLGLALGKPGAAADTPVSFSAFVDALDVTFNADNGTVDCGEGLQTPLMVCGRLPLYLNNTGNADDWAPIGEFALRVPDSQNPADLIDLDDTLPGADAPRKELEIPADLATKLADAVLDFGNLGEGLDGYLARVEAAFRLASFQGKLPLIGDDLQQGADFIGRLRTTLRESVWADLPGAGRPVDTKAFEDFINTRLAAALDDVDIAAIGVTVRSSCLATLASAAAPAVEPTVADGAPTAQWEYRIVAVQGGDAVPGPATAVTGAATLGSGSSNALTWDAVEHATGYKVLRKGAADTAFQLVGTVTEPAFTDDGTATPAAYTPATTAPTLSPCPLEAVDGVFLEFTAQRGVVSANQGCVDAGAPKPCIGDSIPLDIGIPGLALRQGPAEDDRSDGITYDLGFALHFQLGLTKTDGFFVNTHDGWGTDDKARPELQVGLAFDLPDEMLAELAFIDISVRKATGEGHEPSRPLFAGAFQIDLKSTADEAGCFRGDEAACAADDSKRLAFADLGSRDLSTLFGVSLTGRFHLDWNLVAEVDSAFPGVRANFLLDWAFDNRAPDSAGAPTIEFRDVGINAGDFFEQLLGDVVKEMKRVTGPVQPIIDTLYAPIPVLSDLSRMAGGGDVTLISLAKAYSTLKDGPSLDFVDTIKAVVEFINRLPTCEAAVPDDCYVPLGSFRVSGAKALATSNSPATADTMYESQAPAQGGEVKQRLNDVNDNPAAAGKPVFGGPGVLSGDTGGDAEKAGFSFPILDNPASAFTLLMGGDVTLVEFDSGPLTLGFSWRQEFGPVYAPPPVFVTLAGSASVSLRIRAGLDTYGLRKAVESIRNGTKLTALDVLDGLFFKTVDDKGAPAPVVTLTGEIAAGAQVSVFIVKVGIEGGLRLTVGFFWNDPNDDGKFRVSEFLHAALSNPVCLFTMSGKLSLFLRLYVTIGFSIFKKTFKFTLADVTLLDFSVEPDCDPPPPVLGGTVGDTLIVFAGKFGGEDFRGDPTWDNTNESVERDTVKVISLHYAQTAADPQGTDAAFDGFAVVMLGERREYLDPALRRVLVDGTGYDRPMAVTLVGDGKQLTDETAGDSPAVFDKDAVVIGGTAGDIITAGRGLSYVDGRGGDDVIVTGDTGGAGSLAWVAGGPGSDSVTTGNGANLVAGDADLGTATSSRTVTHNAQDGGGTSSLTGVFDWERLADPTGRPGGDGQGDDSIAVGLGANTVYGNGGRDSIGVATDVPAGGAAAQPNLIVGGDGGDRITGGSNTDTIFTGVRLDLAHPDLTVDGQGSTDTESEVPNVVETGTGSDQVYGSTWIDLVTSGSRNDQGATIRGGGHEDVLLGGYGTDEVYGGPGDDHVIAEPADVGEELGRDPVFGPLRDVARRPLPAGVTSSAKLLVGGLGNDHLVGGDGPATMFGDRRIDAERCVAGAAVTSDPVAESTGPGDGDGHDTVLGGAGVDTLSAGGASDVAELGGGADLACGQQGDDTLRAGDGTDVLWGGSGGDSVFGDAGTDQVFGNADGDVLYGGADNDTVEGNDGSDWATGGAGDDVLYGGTRLAGRTDSGGDLLNGDEGVDRLVGDNGADGIPLDLDGATPAAGAGDTLFGGTGDDTAFGGLGPDAVNGGPDADHLEGNNDADTVHGDDGEDHVLGGSFQEAAPGTGRPDTGDALFGDGGADLLAGDNAVLTVVSDPAATTPVTRNRGFARGHAVTLLDLGLTPAAGVSGADLMSGGSGADVLYGQAGSDRVRGDGEDDHAEGGPGIDWIEGDGGADDLVGGSSTPLTGSSGGGDATGQPDGDDALWGGPGDDVALGDNGVLLRPAAGETPTRVTVRLATSGGVPVTPRVVRQYDLAALTAGRYGADRISGGSGVDLLWGQDGGDFLSGGGQADHLQGNGGADVLRGDLALTAASPDTTVVPLADPGWPGVASPIGDLEGTDTVAGQDDLIGGSSAPGFRDGGDTMQGDGADDVQLGDNGSLIRTVQGAAERVYAERYPAGAVPPDATVARTHDPDLPGPSTRFCTTAQATCEPVGAFGDDVLHGNAGNDGLWGQDGDDLLRGGTGDDDVHGELGADVLYGDEGSDALLGDRGGVVPEYLNADDVAADGFTVSLSSVPQESYTGFRAGAYDRRVDLRHDVDGDAFIGSGTSAAMPHDGITTGGDDRLRGGPGADNLHAGFGDDLANGDSGGDQVFGADGADVLWGGKGCDPVLDATTPDCLVNGVFDPASRGDGDRFVDHVFGGVGGTSAASNEGALGSDVLDFNPRGSYPANCVAGAWPQTLGSGAIDPCRWFEMTDKTNDAVTEADNQHHHGTDWIYGGWDRDVLQADQAANGPNPGDRLMDWNGTYNLFTHCNAAYGGFNDVRQHSPAMRTFLQQLAWASGAGQAASDATTAGTSAFREVAISYSEDIRDHAAGSAYPSTPGHFDQPVACSD
ncbi:MAG TPA: calcium-binding protein [Pseudonocardiaceae bacterium]